MGAKKYRASWDDIAYLDADHLARHGVLGDFTGPLSFEGYTPKVVDVDVHSGKLVARYQWEGEGAASRVRSVIELDRRPCCFGGARAFFICPRCARRTLRLAVLPAGLRCGTCGAITWGSRRETKTQRIVRRANKLAGRLGLEHFADPPLRPVRMRTTTYLAIVVELERLKREINRRAAARVARAGSAFTAMTALVRWGL